MTDDLKGALPESWACIDCGVNTAPGCSTREQLEQAFAAGAIRNKQGVTLTIDEFSEVYMVKTKIWKAAGMGDFGGCLCIGCLEKRIGRRLVPKDFMRNHAFSILPGTELLLQRRETNHNPSQPSATNLPMILFDASARPRHARTR